MRGMRRLTLLLLTISLACAVPAAAQVTVAGTGEPAFTNTTTNTQWVQWSAGGYDGYRLRYDYYDNAVATGTVTVNQGAGGTAWASWAGVVNTLVQGHTYGICVTGEGLLSGMWFPDGSSTCQTGPQTGKRASTTIDRTKPVAGMTIDDGAAFTRSTGVGYDVSYTDNLAFPFPANFVCVGFGGADCTGAAMQYDADCSVPAAPASKSTSFSCTDQLGAGAPDGLVTACVVAADAAIPDNPNSANQAGSATQANLSTPACDSITLDRTPPSVSSAATSTAVTAGQAVGFTAQASDATSGLSGAFEWAFGDGQTGIGAAVSHAYSAPGSYEANVTVRDAAGNESSKAVTIVVEAAPATGGGGTVTGSDTSGGGATGGGAPAPTPTAPTPGAAVAGLDGEAPKRLRSARARALPLALTATGAGRASIALVRAGRVHAQGAAVVRAAGTHAYRLKLPRRLRAGAYTVKVAWVPVGSATARTRTLRLLVGAATGVRARRAVAAATRPLVDPAGAPYGLPDGR